jgi:hypothetical protein
MPEMSMVALPQRWSRRGSGEVVFHRVAAPIF